MTAPILFVTVKMFLIHSIPEANREATPAPTSATPSFNKIIEVSAQIERETVATPIMDKDDHKTNVGDTNEEKGILRNRKVA